VYNQYGIAFVGLRQSGSKKIAFAPLDEEYRLSIGDSMIIIAGERGEGRDGKGKGERGD
jgi:hypothetical protein